MKRCPSPAWLHSADKMSMSLSPSSWNSEWKCHSFEGPGSDCSSALTLIACHRSALILAQYSCKHDLSCDKVLKRGPDLATKKRACLHSCFSNDSATPCFECLQIWQPVGCAIICQARYQYLDSPEPFGNKQLPALLESTPFT